MRCAQEHIHRQLGNTACCQACCCSWEYGISAWDWSKCVCCTLQSAPITAVQLATPCSPCNTGNTALQHLPAQQQPQQAAATSLARFLAAVGTTVAAHGAPPPLLWMGPPGAASAGVVQQPWASSSCSRFGTSQKLQSTKVMNAAGTGTDTVPGCTTVVEVELDCSRALAWLDLVPDAAWGVLLQGGTSQVSSARVCTGHIVWNVEAQSRQQEKAPQAADRQVTRGTAQACILCMRMPLCIFLSHTWSLPHLLLPCSCQAGMGILAPQGARSYVMHPTSSPSCLPGDGSCT
jgi:hypothetical protein